MVAIFPSLLAALAIIAPIQAMGLEHGGPARRARGPLSHGSSRRHQSLGRRAPEGVKRTYCNARRRQSQGQGIGTTSVGSDNVPTIKEIPEVQAKPVKVAKPKPQSVAAKKPKSTTTTAKAVIHSSTPEGAAFSGSDVVTGGTGKSSGLTSSQEDEFLSLHNAIRSQHGAKPLTWSHTLAEAGKTWADKCVFEHSRGALGPFGENLAAGTGGAYNVAAAMKSWTDEITDYNPGNPQPSHYTQVVWKGTTEVGCALAPACNGIFDPKFGTAKYFVCEYLPAGNVIGRFAQNVQ